MRAHLCTDLHENLIGGQVLSYEHKFQISLRGYGQIMLPRRFCLVCVPLCTDLYENLVGGQVLSYKHKFHKDPSFHCGDMAKICSAGVFAP